MSQLDIFDLGNRELNLNDYDKIIIAFSGGKDSISCHQHIRESGVSDDKIELWHHEIDGREGSKLMDWPITPAYCRAYAAAFNVPIYFSWKQGGFEREMMRDQAKTAPTIFEDGNHELQQIGGTRGKEGTRLKFPQVSPDLKVRWCSAYLKIDVCAAAIRNQERFNGIKTLLVSGERGEESKARAGYAIKEPDRADGRNGRKARLVDRWRPIRDWTEQQVWEIIQRNKIRVHPCYYMGFSRCSCLFCIFGNADQFSSAQVVNPEGFEDIANKEKDFGITIKRDKSLRELVANGTPYEAITEDLRKIAMSTIYTEDIVMSEEWVLPAGAYGKSCGPS